MNLLESIRALFAFPGFTTSWKLLGVFADRYARVIQLKRRKKTAICLHCVHRCRGGEFCYRLQ